MSSPQVIEKAPMSVTQVKVALERIKASEEGLELNFRAQKTMEYAEDFAKLPPTDAEEVFAAIRKLEIPRLKDAYIHKLIDLLPQSEKSVKVVLSSYHMSVPAEQIKKIAEILQEHAPKRQ